MDSKFYQLDYILNIEKFQKIQDDMSKATEMAIIAVDFKGNPVTKHSRCQAFCTLVRSDEKLNDLCEKCDSRGGLEAARLQKPYVYMCHMGVVDVAIPITVDDQYLGALMMGQIKLEDENNISQLERIVSKRFLLDNCDYPEIETLYAGLPIMKLEKIQAVAQMVFHMVNYMVEEAILKAKLNERNRQLNLTKPKPSPVNTVEDAPKIVEEHKDLIIKPALDYMKDNCEKKIYLDDMAYRCNISSSYFSRLFKREVGESFSSYLNKLKVERAKTILDETDEPIINISLNLGYEDCGYFIKVFKKYVGTTPAQYRKVKS
ncbi:AraC family transcriptional regulator [Acidaminobacter sp. JC074]|uniref:PocR ligand-binding domain-containing protein n=1 Tax=Acidaminobacter sp. JC074 TaxID=2530199 RepID=UPI001F101AAC|nr:PocR ligand-binding domain-containing protein [Acidaminobacter sp. JC074]MCH4886361.1 AraC family transcriptional regulator [Acidaminobacter sp. JC074]